MAKLLPPEICDVEPVYHLESDNSLISMFKIYKNKKCKKKLLFLNFFQKLRMKYFEH